MTDEQLTEMRVMLRADIVSELAVLCRSDHKTHAEVVAAAILAFAETVSYERDVLYYRTGIQDDDIDE